MDLQIRINDLEFSEAEVRMLAVAEGPPTAFGRVVGGLATRVVQEHAQVGEPGHTGRPINWALSHEQYDEMIKYATAPRLGTAETEAILRRFTRNNLQHPTYRALTELGKAVRTVFPVPLSLLRGVAPRDP